MHAGEQHPSSLPRSTEDALSVLGASYTSRLLDELGKLAAPVASVESIEKEKKLVALEMLALIRNALLTYQMRNPTSLVEAPPQPFPSVQLTVDEVGALFDATCGDS